MTKAIIFDFGGVFSTDDDIPTFWKNHGVKLGVDPEEASKISRAIWLEARLGKIDSNILWEELGALTKLGTEKFRKYFLDTTGFRHELLDYVKQNLKGKYKLAILSNHIDTWLEPILEEKKFKDIFDVIVTSYKAGFAKPDVEIYERVLKDLGLAANECIYIEDRPRNLEPAVNLGMSVIEFKNFEQMVSDLNHLLQK